MSVALGRAWDSLGHLLEASRRCSIESCISPCVSVTLLAVSCSSLDTVPWKWTSPASSIELLWQGRSFSWDISAPGSKAHPRLLNWSMFESLESVIAFAYRIAPVWNLLGLSQTTSLPSARSYLIHFDSKILNCVGNAPAISGMAQPKSVLGRGRFRSLQGKLIPAESLQDFTGLHSNDRA